MTDAIKAHYESCWGSITTSMQWTKGPYQELPNDFHILVFAPRDPRAMWTYATCGMSSLNASVPIELHLFSPLATNSHIELLTVIAHYHLKESPVDVGHTVNFGRPWLPGSQCEYGLVSLPYLDGPNLEWLSLHNKEIHFCWLIPITEREREYKKINGLDALEDEFDRSNFNYIDVHRNSIV